MHSHSPGGGWPSTTGNPSGGGRHNGPAGGSHDDDDDDTPAKCEYCEGRKQIWHMGHWQLCPNC